MKATPLHAQWIWSDYQLAKVRSGRLIQKNRDNPSNWGAWPVPRTFSIVVHENGVDLHVDRGTEPEQIELGAVAETVESFWRIDNATTILSFGQAKALAELLGWKTAFYRNSWKKRIYRNPIRITRSGQRYPLGFDSLHRQLAAGGVGRNLTKSDFYSMSVKAIGPTLEPAEARRFYEATR